MTLLGFPRFALIESIGDGRHLVVPAEGDRAGQLLVVGESDREAEAARMGYLPRRPVVPRAVRPVPRILRRSAIVELPPTPRHLVVARGPSSADRRARDLLESLLDERQLQAWRRWKRFWVETPRGPVRLGSPYDLRFRPLHRWNEEWSLCVVPTGERLPICDVWSNLLLTLSVHPDRFFAVANVRARGLEPSRPHP